MLCNHVNFKRTLQTPVQGRWIFMLGISQSVGLENSPAAGGFLTSTRSSPAITKPDKSCPSVSFRDMAVNCQTVVLQRNFAPPHKVFSNMHATTPSHLAHAWFSQTPELSPGLHRARASVETISRLGMTLCFSYGDAREPAFLIPTSLLRGDSSCPNVDSAIV